MGRIAGGHRGARAAAGDRLPAGGGDPLASAPPSRTHRRQRHAARAVHPHAHGRPRRGRASPTATRPTTSRRTPTACRRGRTCTRRASPSSRTATSSSITTTPARRTTSRTGAPRRSPSALKQTRICAHVRFRHRTQRTFGPIDVFNTHLSLPSTLSREFWTKPRRMGWGPNQLEEAKNLANFVERERASDRFVVVGDFNALPGSPVYELPRRRPAAGSTPSRTATS